MWSAGAKACTRAADVTVRVPDRALAPGTHVRTVASALPIPSSAISRENKLEPIACSSRLTKHTQMT